MATTNLDREIRSRIDSFLADLSSMVKLSALQAVHDALGAANGSTAPRRGPGRPRKNAAAPSAAAVPRAGKRGKRTSENVQAMADQVLGYIKKNEGQRLEQISKGLGVTSKELKLPVQKLFAAKAIKTKGQKRGTMYFAK